MSDSAAPVGRSPVNVALVSCVGEVRTKSSADSISMLPAELGREAVAAMPSGIPVVKKKGSANAGLAHKITTVVAPMQWARLHRAIGLISDSMLRTLISPGCF